MLHHDVARLRMIWRLARAHRLGSVRLARAMAGVPRHLFVPPHLAEMAYSDEAFDVLEGQPITCPGFVAQMTSLLDVGPGDRVLDIGTGTGYQAAVLAALGCEVVSVEVRPALHLLACANLRRARIEGVELLLGDGALGVPQHAPFDAIVMACAPQRVPDALLEQLAVGGRLVGPVGHADRIQTLVRMVKTSAGVEREAVRGAWFVPMVGRAG